MYILDIFQGLLCLRIPMVGVCVFLASFNIFLDFPGRMLASRLAAILLSSSLHERLHQHILDSSLGVGVAV